MKKKSISRLKNKLWELTKQIVRAKWIRKDGTFRCYTCGAVFTSPQAQTSHFVASSICGAGIRYDYDRNLRICCYRCNINLSGNFPAFQENLIKELGKKEVDKILQDRHKITKADVFWYEDKISEYSALLDTL